MSSLAKSSLSKPSPAKGRRRLVAAPLFAGLLIGALAGAAPARAQFFIDEPEIRLPPRAVVANLARRGYRDITHPAFDGETYTLTAADPRGIRVRLVLDAFDGAVLDRVRFEAAPVPPGFVGRPTRPGYGWTEEEPEARPMRRVERPQRGEPQRPPVAVAARPATDPGGPAIAPPAAMTAAPSGMNPDAGRPAPARPETRAARAPDAVKLGPKPAVPAAPVPTVAPAEVAKAPAPPAPKPEAAKLEAAKPAEPAPVSKVVEPKPAETASPPAAQPTAEPPQRQVRVIEGVTPPNAAPAAKPAEAATESGS